MSFEEKTNMDPSGGRVETDVVLHLPRDPVMPFVQGVVAYGVLTIGLLAVLAVVTDSPRVLAGLVVAAALAYLNFSFVHALNAGALPGIGYKGLVGLANVTAVACCATVLAALVYFVTII